LSGLWPQLCCVNASQAFADVKAVVTIVCDPDTDRIVRAQASNGSPVTSLPASNKCTDAMVFLTQTTSR